MTLPQKSPLHAVNETHQKTPSSHPARQTGVTSRQRHDLPATAQQCGPCDLTAADVPIHHVCLAHLSTLFSPPDLVQKNTKNTETQYSLLT